MALSRIPSLGLRTAAALNLKSRSLVRIPRSLAAGRSSTARQVLFPVNLHHPLPTLFHASSAWRSDIEARVKKIVGEQLGVSRLLVKSNCAANT